MEKEAFEAVKCNNFVKAKQLYLQVIKTTKNNRIHFNLGMVYRQLQEPVLAIEQFKLSIELDEWMIASYVMYAVTLFEMKAYKKSISLYGIALVRMRDHLVIEYEQMGLDMIIFKHDILCNRALSFYFSDCGNFAEMDLQEARFICKTVPSINELVHTIPIHSLANSVFSPQNTIIPTNPLAYAFKTRIFGRKRHNSESDVIPFRSRVNSLGKHKSLKSPLSAGPITKDPYYIRGTSGTSVKSTSNDLEQMKRVSKFSTSPQIPSDLIELLNIAEPWLLGLPNA